jgi:hypothetical protein
MPTVDFRTRHAGDAVALGPEWLHDTLPAVLRETGPLGGRAVEVLGLSTLGFEVDGDTAHLAAVNGSLTVRAGLGDGPVAVLDAGALSDLVQDAVSTFGLNMAARVEVRQGTVDDFIAWEPVLRAVLDGRSVYEPGSIAFPTPAGGALDLERSFRLDDSPAEIGHFLARAGYLHLEGVFTEAEMAEVSAELAAAGAAARQDDGASWWARTEAEGWYAARILGFNLLSPTLQDLLETDRFQAIGAFTDDAMVQRPPREGDSAEGLVKKVGVVEGISDVSWHKDCSMGGHSRRCCALTVGISVTGADAGSGELGVVAGSHRANVQPIDLRAGLDLPRIPLPTRTGDCTVHCSCTLHMSRPPVAHGRQVVYTGFNLAPRPGDVVAPLDPEEVRRNRAALSDQVQAREQRGEVDRENPKMFSLPERG